MQRTSSPHPFWRGHRRSSLRGGFTLVELLVSTAVLSVLMMVTLSALETMQRSWRDTKGKVSQFRESRIAFETLTRNLSQATLNTYWDYYFEATSSNVPPDTGSTSPAGYVRQSELDFCILPAVDLGSGETAAELPGHALFFQAPLGQSQGYRGLGTLLNARGYYIHFESNQDSRPPFLQGRQAQPKFRYRLMEYRPPAEKTGQETESLAGNAIYKQADWYRQNLQAVSRPIADNVLLLIISPEVTPELADERRVEWIAPFYRYRSRDADNSTAVLDNPTVGQDGTISQGTQHLLPPRVRVTLVACDEESFERWHSRNGNLPVDLCSEAAADFSQARHYNQDLDRLKQYLTAEKLNFRVFIQTVTMRNAMWESSAFGLTKND